jgi:4a-hydroxytetrahydrobiopterin dehydratase
MSKLTLEQINKYVSMLHSWKFENQSLVKIIQTEDFKASIKLVRAIADIAEKAEHHPDLLIQYNRITITLTTHESEGVTGKDFSLAQQIDALENSLS